MEGSPYILGLGLTDGGPHLDHPLRGREMVEMVEMDEMGTPERPIGRPHAGA